MPFQCVVPEEESVRYNSCTLIYANLYGDNSWTRKYVKGVISVSAKKSWSTLYPSKIIGRIVTGGGI